MAWLRFVGTAKRTISGWRLVPEDDPKVSIDMGHDDVRVDGATVIVRQGSYALDIRVPSNSPARMAPSYRSRKQCPGGISRCLGGIEYCCDNEAKGTCNGLWDDC